MKTPPVLSSTDILTDTFEVYHIERSLSTLPDLANFLDGQMREIFHLLLLFSAVDNTIPIVPLGSTRKEEST
jgi:hypothetical protein